MSGSAPLAAFGNAITSRIVSRPATSGDDPVDAHRDPTVRRRAVAQSVEEEAEPRLGVLGADPQQIEHALLDLALVDTDRPAADLGAVEDEVVRA